MKKCSLCNIDDVVAKYHNKCQRCNRAYLFGREQAVAKAKAMIVDVQVGAWYAEQERIIELLEEKLKVLNKIETGHGYGSEINSIRGKTIESVIALIKDKE